LDRSAQGRRRDGLLRRTALKEPAPPSDEELVALAAVRDASGAQAFSALYDRHASFVYGISKRFLRDSEEAEDLLQEIFAKLWERKIRFQPGRARFTTWLFTVTRNRCIDMMKSSARKATHVPLPDDALSFAEDGPESDTYGSECCRRVRAVIAELPEHQKRALAVCAFQGLTHNEAAKVLQIPLGTLKSRVKAAMSKIAANLAESEGTE